MPAFPLHKGDAIEIRVADPVYASQVLVNGIELKGLVGFTFNFTRLLSNRWCNEIEFGFDITPEQDNGHDEVQP